MNNQVEVSDFKKKLWKHRTRWRKFSSEGKNEKVKVEEKEIKTLCLGNLRTISIALSAYTSSYSIDDFQMERGRTITRPVHYRVQSNSDVDFNPSALVSLDLWEDRSVLSGISKNRAQNQRILKKYFAYALDASYCDENCLFVPRFSFDLRKWVLFLDGLDTKNKVEDGLFQRFVRPFVQFLLSWLRTATEHGLSHGDLLKCIYFVDEQQPRLLVSEGFEFKNLKKQDKFYQEDLDAVKHIFFLVINRCSVNDLLNIGCFDCASLTNDILQPYVDLHYDLKSFDNSCVPRVALNPPFLWHPHVALHHIRCASKYFFHYNKKKCENIKNELQKFNMSSAWSGWKTIVKGADETNVIKRFYKEVSTEENPCKAKEEHSEMAEEEKSYKIFYNENSGLLRFGRNTIEHLNERLDRVLTDVQILGELDKSVNFSRRLSIGMHDVVKGWSKEMQSRFLDEVAYPK